MKCIRNHRRNTLCVIALAVSSLSFGARAGGGVIEAKADTDIAKAIVLAPNAELYCSGKNNDAPVYLTRDDEGTIERFELRRTERGEMSGQYVSMSESELNDVCQQGITLALMRKPVAEEASPKDLPHDAKTTPSSSLPTSFSVFSWGNSVIGNIWVPGSLPSTHNAHSVQFDVQQNGFQSASQAGGGHHVVVFLLASSPNNFAQNQPPDYHGKGMIFGWHGIHCSSQNGGNGVYAAATETWVNPNVQANGQSYPCTSPYYLAEARVASGVATNNTCVAGGPGFFGFRANEAPWHTCKFLSSTQSYTYNVSATRSQLTKYWMRPVGSSSWQPAA